MSKRILVTGGAGFLGHHLVEHIIKNTDWTVAVLDNLNYASKGFDRLRDIGCYDHARIDRYVWNIANPMEAAMEREIGHVDYIAHCAAETHVDNSIRDPWPFVQANVVGTFRMLEYARRCAGLERLLYFSTDEVFGPAAPLYEFKPFVAENRRLEHFQTYQEWDRYNSTNPYSATKAAGEELCLAWANTYRVPVVVSHCMNLFGERQHVEKFIPQTIRKLQRGERIIVHSDPSKQRAGSRSYLHARNAADAVLFLLAHARARDKYNVAGDRECDNLALAQMIADEMNVPLDYEMTDFHSSRPGHDMRYALDGTKLADMGWQSPLSFEESLQKTIRWYLAHPEWLED